MSWVGIFTSLHILGATIWVGGLFMLVVIIWPSINQTVINHQAFLKASVDVFNMFMPWLIGVSLLTVLSGLVAFFAVYKGFEHAPVYLHTMFALGIIMFLLVGHLIVSPWKKMNNALETQAWDTLEKLLPKAKLFVSISLGFGVILILIGGSGPYWG